MLDRREFLKKCYQIGGIAAITGLGMGAVEKAMGWGILPSIVGGGSVSPYDAWNESDEAGWGDSANAYICMFTGADSTNETGQGGGLTGADLVITQKFGVGAAVGPPWKRPLDTGVGFDMTDVATNFIKSTTWSVFLKVQLTAAPGEATFLQFFQNADGLAIQSNGSSQLTMQVDAVTSAATATALPTSNVYIYAESDGTNDAKIGWSATKVASWEAIPSAQKSTTVAKHSLAGETAQYGNINGAVDNFNNAALQFTGFIYYIILANKTILL